MESAFHLAFGHIPLPLYQTFYMTDFSYCSCNLKPFVPGHILIMPRRPVPTLDLLTDDEAVDIMLVLKKMTRMIKLLYHTESVTTCIQDGPPAGQTVPHVGFLLISRNLLISENLMKIS